MTDVTDYLDQVQARADAATEGPWEWEPEWVSDDGLHYRPPRAFVETWTGYPINDASEAVLPGTSEDAEFIAAARSDVPRLVAAVRAVLELHESFEFDGLRRCRECTDYDDRDYSAPWPCPTVQAITEALEVE